MAMDQSGVSLKRFLSTCQGTNKDGQRVKFSLKRANPSVSLTKMKNNQSNRHEISSDHDNLPLFSVLNSNSGGGGGALLDGGTLPSSNDFDN